MILTMMGYRINEKALEAGRAAIKAQRRDFGALTIAHAIRPHIRAGAKAWARVTPDMAAVAAANQLISDALKAGDVERCTFSVSAPTWRNAR